MFGGLFGRSQRRNAIDATKALREALNAAKAHDGSDEKEIQKLIDNIATTMRVMKETLYREIGSPESSTSGDHKMTEAEEQIAELVSISRTTDFLQVMADGLSVMGFETRKESVLVFNNLLRRTMEDEVAAKSLVSQYGESLTSSLVRGYEMADVALNCGAMLRECIRYESLATAALRSTVFWRFFDLVEVADFDVASDAFLSFTEMLMRHVSVGASFIENNYDRFTGSYNKLLRSSNYMTRRQSLKLLGSLFFERRMYKVMMRYISCATNLRLAMNLLLDQRISIQYEAFQVFLIFVSNPKKTLEVNQILLRNKDRLLSYLTDFQADRDDESFQKDRQHLLAEIRKLA